MQVYSFDDINAAIGDCLHFATTELGLVPVNGSDHFNSPWRSGSDSGAFHIFPLGWKDHVSQETGTALKLYANIKCGGDIFVAQDELGQRYNCKPRMSVKEARKIVKEYVYETLDGKPLHKTIRYEPKEFSQARWDETTKSWKSGLADTKLVLYRHKEWANSSCICVVGGEKDVDNAFAAGIPATTNALGEGNWREDYNGYFREKRVVIVPDNDEVGRLHAQTVAFNIKDIAAEVRIIPMPGVDDKGDISDWLAKGGTKEQFTELVNNTPKLTVFLPPPPQKHIRDISEAKSANAKPFTNYRTMEVEQGGTKKIERQPIPLNEMMNDLYRRFWGFPRMLGDSLFDHDRKSGDIRYIDSPDSLFAWIAEKSGHNVNWSHKGDGIVSQSQFFETIRANSRKYSLISSVPNWPPRDDVYYTHDAMPTPTPDAKWFNKFCSFFSPTTEDDAILLKVFFATPIYYKRKVDKPLWIIDASTGQGTGKSRLVEMLCCLYGGMDTEQGAPIMVNQTDFKTEQAASELRKRMLSRTGRKKRIFLIDNVTGYFHSNALATMITQECLTGRAPYGRGEESRVNDLTYVITSNCSNVNKDLAARSFYMQIKKPEPPIPAWEATLQDFIQKHRMEVISDIIGILDKGPRFSMPPSTRFRQWEIEIMQPICGDADIYNRALRCSNTKRSDSDGEAEIADEVKACIIANIKAAGLETDSATFIPNTVVSDWLKHSSISDFQSMMTRNIPHTIRSYAKGGSLPEILPDVMRYPNSDSARGIAWLWGQRRHGFGPQVMQQVIKVEGEKSNATYRNPCAEN